MHKKVAVFAICMLLTGSINTISTKYQDMFVIGYTKAGIPLTFKHPAVQSACMFFGETLCLIPYFYLRWKKKRNKKKSLEQGVHFEDTEPSKPRSFYIKRVLVFAIPALCDACATTLLNVGLFYTFASTYQMLRGTMVLFAGLFTILILRRTLHTHHWLGMVLIMAGAALVGASSVISASKTEQHQKYHYLDVLRPLHRLVTGTTAGPSGAEAPLFGDILVVAAQMVAALQFILEEKFLKKYKVPTLMAVGVEGCWGMLLCLIVCPIFTVIKAPDGLPIDDAIGAAQEIVSNMPLLIAVVGSTVSIAFFNFFGISVTKHLSGAARATIDACRTIFIWLFSLQVGWEKFHPLEVVGFVVLLCGTSLYNEILRSCLPSSTSTPEPAHYHQHPQRSRRNTEDGDLTQPLLPNPTPHQPVPVPRPRAVSRVAAGAASGGTSSDMYTMARSMRLGASALSPHSLDSYEERPSSLLPDSFTPSADPTLAVDIADSLDGSFVSGLQSRSESQSTIPDLV